MKRALIFIALSLVVLSMSQVVPNATLSNFRYIVHQNLSEMAVQLPSEIKVQTSNNCIGMLYYQGRLYLGWRTAPSHFASNETVMYIISSADNGTKSWDFEHQIYLESDLREPYFYVFNGTLHFTFFQAGTKWDEFTPKFLYRIVRNGFQDWTAPEEWGQPGEIAWQYQTTYDSTGAETVYVGSYIGTHYDPKSDLNVYFNYSTDGVNFKSILSNGSWVYHGGISEVGFTFDDNGDLYAVGRNEDGDESGSGSRFFFIPKSSGYQDWNQIYPSATESDPYIYESPRMFTWNNQTFLLARRDLDGKFDVASRLLPFAAWKYYNLAHYSLVAHTTSLWMLDKENKTLIWIEDLPGDGDTAFESIIQTGPNTFTVANYASPLDHPDWSWIKGQTNPTQIYFIDLTFTDNYFDLIQ